MTAVHYTYDNSGFINWLMAFISGGADSVDMEYATNGREDIKIDSSTNNSRYTKTTFDIASGDFLSLSPVSSLKGNIYDIEIMDSINSSTRNLDYRFGGADDQENGTSVTLPSISEGDDLSAEVKYTYDEKGNWTEAVIGPFSITRSFTY